MAKQYTLTERAARQVQRAVRWVERNQQQPRQETAVGSSPTILIGEVESGGITALSGSTPGSGTVKVCRINSSGTIENVAAHTTGGDVTVTVYNLSSDAFSAGQYVPFKQELKSGKYVLDASGIGQKQLCRFTLDSALTISDATQDATITNQYGPGSDHGVTDITVRNLLCSTGDYLFYGDSGHAGLAVFDTGATWVIVQLECP